MSTPITNPYVGPRPFKKDEANRFFGREREARELLALVSSQRLVLFYASSGAGKSSLINARLIDSLVGRGFEVLPVGRVSGVLPREVSVTLSAANVFSYFLKQSLVEFSLDDALDEAGQRFFQEYAGASLSEFLLHLSSAGKDDAGSDRYVFTPPGAPTDETPVALPEGSEVELRPRALIIDQFEEIFTTNLQAWEQRDDFFTQVHQAMEDDPYLWVVVAMREDFIANLDPYAHLLPGELHARYYMQRMGYAAALEAVTKPVEVKEPVEWNRPFAPGVAEKLVDNLRQVHVVAEESEGVATAAGEFIEPVQLQVVCYQLWEQLRDTPGTEITDADLDRLAGGKDLGEFVDRALAEFYELAIRRVLNQVGALVSEMELRRWFSERLITESGTRGFVYRGESETGGLSNDVVRLIAREFLIRSESRAGGTWYELSHDRFVDPILRSNQVWSLEQLQKNPLLRRAHEWAASHQDSGRRDAALLMIDEELRTVDTGDQAHDPIIQEFVEASKRAKEQRDLAEAQRNEEMAQRQLEEAVQREAAEKRLSRRLKVAIVAAAVMAVSALLAWGIVFRQLGLLSTKAVALQNETKQLDVQKKLAETNLVDAVEARKEAVAARLTAQSLTLANQSLSSPEIADRLLLARAALSDTTTLPATTALLTGLDQGYRNSNYRSEAFVPLDRLDLANGGPWRSMAFSNDGSMLALGDETGGIRLLDNATGEPIGGRLSMPGPYRVNSLAFDPTGTRLAAVTADRDDPAAAKHALILWDLRNPDAPESTVLASDQASMWSVAFSPDGELAVGNKDGTVDLWNLSGSDPISRTLPGRHADWAYSVTFDAEGKRLASGGKDGKIILWSELSSREPISQTLADHTAWVNAVAFSPDDAQLASGSDDGTVRLWNLTENPPSSVVLGNHQGEGIEAWDLAFSPDNGKLLAAGWGDGLVRVYDTERPDSAPWQLAGHSGEAWQVAFAPTQPRRLISLSDYDSEPIAWDLSQPSEFVARQPFAHPITSTLQAISANGQWLASVGDDRRVYLTDLGASSPPISFTVPMSITAVAFNADGSQVALAGCEPVATQAAREAPAGSPTAEAPKSGSTTNPKSGGSSSSGSATANCKLTLWPAGGEPPISPSRTITFAQPIRAVAFHPQAADDLVVGLESGEVRTYNLSTRAAKNLPEGVFAPIDLAFSTDGRLLAALGKTGLVRIWNWSTGELVDQSESLEGESEFSAINFVYGDAWLAITSNVPQLELWERGTWKKVATFALDSGGSADLAFDAAQQILISVQPDGLVRWPMDQAAWLELACSRAHRNLSYQAWRTGFPAEENYDSARICPDFPLDVSFANTLVEEANKVIDDCTPEQLTKGRSLLEEAARMDVDPPLDLKPLDEVLRVLSDQALDDLRQPSRLLDKHARACLQLAVDQLAEAGQPALDPTQAFTVGQSLVNAQDLLADPYGTDIGTAVDDLEYVRENRDQWPVDLPSVLSLLPQAYFRLCQPGDVEGCRRSVAGLEYVLEHSDQWPVDLPSVFSLLPQAYYQLCQQGDAEGCRRFEKYAELLNYGQEIDRSFQAGQEDPLSFRGQEGDWVTVNMNSSEFDTYLNLQGPDGFDLSNDDTNGSNSQIEFVVPKDNVYLIRPGAFSGEGAYRLTLKGTRPEDLNFRRPVTSTTQANTLWAFEGEQGQAVGLNLETTVLGLDPYLAVQQVDGTRLAEAGTSDGGRNARIAAFILPAKGRYLVKTLRPGAAPSTAPYTLTLTTVMPSTIGVGQTVTSPTQGNPYWAFSGQAGQIVDIAMTTVDSGFDPYLTLYGGRGIKLAENGDSGGTYNALIPAFILTRTATYTIEAGGAGSIALYQLSLAASQPLTLTLDSSIEVTRSGAFRFSGQDDQLVAMHTDPPADLALVGPGRLLVEHSPAILTLLDASSPFTAVVHLPVNAYSVTLRLDTVSGGVAQLAFNQPPAPGQMQATSPDVWSFLDAGAKGVEIAVKPAAGRLDLELYDPGGALITSADGTNRLLSALPTAGTYLLMVRPHTAAAAGPYTIEIKPVDVEQGPQACLLGQLPDYGPIRIGSRVILHRHRAVPGDASWDETMAQYVGRQATVTSLAGVDNAGCPEVQVEIDNTGWYWRIRDMSILN